MFMFCPDTNLSYLVKINKIIKLTKDSLSVVGFISVYKFRIESQFRLCVFDNPAIFNVIKTAITFLNMYDYYVLNSYIICVT